MAAMNGGENLIRFRTSGGGGAHTYALDMELACPGGACPDVKGVSILVHSGHPDAAGYSGIEISVSTDGSSFGTPLVDRDEMFGAYDRDATYQTAATDFTFDRWLLHKFSEVQVGVKKVCRRPLPPSLPTPNLHQVHTELLKLRYP